MKSCPGRFSLTTEATSQHRMKCVMAAIFNCLSARYRKKQEPDRDNTATSGVHERKTYHRFYLPHTHLESLFGNDWFALKAGLVDCNGYQKRFIRSNEMFVLETR